MHPFENAVSSANVVSRFGGGGRVRQLVGRRDRAGEVPPRAHRQHTDDAGDEKVGGHREDASGLAHATQVADRQDADEPERDFHAVGRPLGKCGGERRDAGSHADGDRQHVVDEKRGRRNQTGERPEVLLRDDVGAAAAGIRVDRLSIREDDDGQRDGDDNADRRGQAQGGDTADQQHAEDFLGRVGDRRERVRREHRQTRHTGQALVMGLVRRDGRAHEDALELEQERFVGHRTLQSPTGLADGLEVGVLYHPPSRFALRRDGFAPSSGMLVWVPRIASA